MGFQELHIQRNRAILNEAHHPEVAHMHRVLTKDWHWDHQKPVNHIHHYTTAEYDHTRKISVNTKTGHWKDHDYEGIQHAGHGHESLDKHLEDTIDPRG
jgi:hypothetical protein